MISFDRRILLILAGLTVLLLGIIAAASLLRLSSPMLVPESGLISPRGPLELVFSQPVRADSLIGRLSLFNAQNEALTGRLEVSGAQVRFWPEQALLAGQEYTLRVEAGVQSQSGFLLRSGQSYAVRARPVEVLYLATTAAAELWAALPGDGANSLPAARQLSFTNGRVYDYDVSSDGNQIFYSVYNEQGGIDIWKMGRTGSLPDLLLPCQTDMCFNPAIAPDGLLLAYSRRQAGALPSQDPGAPHLWLFDMTDLSTELLTPDPGVAGFQPVWSPDGDYLAFSDAINDAAHIFERQREILFSEPASLNGWLRWFPDSRHLFISIIEGGGSDAPPYVKLFTLNVDTRQREQVLVKDNQQMDYSLPELSPDGEWLIVGLRRVDSGAGKGLWQMRLDGSQRTEISSGALFTNGAYSWSPDGSRVIYQRFELGSSRSLPKVLLWSAQLSEPILIAEDAVLPRWLP